MLGRFLGCLLAGLAGGAALAVLFAFVGERLTYDPSAASPIGNWSGLVGAVVGMAVGWVAGTVTAPAVLLRLLGVRLDATRLILGILAGIGVSGALVALGEVLAIRAPAIGALLSAATFVAFTMAASERST